MTEDGRQRTEKALHAPQPSPFGSLFRSIFTIRKDQFCFKRIRESKRSGLWIHDWLLTRTQGSANRDRSYPFSVLCHPSSGNRMRFLFTMSEIRRQRTEDRGRMKSKADRSVFLDARKRMRRVSSETDESHRKEPNRGRRARTLSVLRRLVSVVRLVEPDGIEPTTSCLQSTRSPTRGRTSEVRRRTTPAAHGGARRDRTDDLMLAKHALSQLSYSPAGLSVVRSLSSVVRPWWAWEDLNLRPHAYQARALTN